MKATEEVASWGRSDQWDDLDMVEKVAIMDSLKSSDAGRTELFKAGKYPLTKHGIFNPSCVKRGEDLEVVFRTEPSEATWAGYMLTDKAVPQISTGKINDEGFELSDPKPLYSGMPSACRPEDWRLFLHKGKTYTNFTNYFYLNQGYPQKVVRCKVGIGICLSNRIQFLRESSIKRTKIPTGREEKNWAFFSNDNQLYCIYSIEPWVVIKMDDTGLGISQDTKEIRFPRLGFRYLSCSTNPIWVNLPKWGNVYFMFCHQFYTPKGRGSRNRTYYQHAIIFGKDMQPIAWTPRPLVGGGDHIGGRHNGVVYFSGSFEHKKNIFALSGEGDSYSSMYRFDKGILANQLKEI